MSALVWPKNAKWTPNSSSSQAAGPELMSWSWNRSLPSAVSR